MNCWAIIVAAGKGTRSGLKQNKVFFELDGRSILARCLDAFQGSHRFDGAVLVLSDEDEAMYGALVEREGPFPLVKTVVHGGETRRDSVLNGLLAVPQRNGVAGSYALPWWTPSSRSAGMGV